GSMNVEGQRRLQEQARAHGEKIAALTDVRGDIGEGLKTLTAEALRANQGAFLELANQVFEKHKVGADAELMARQAAVAKLISPLQDMLQSYRQQIEQLERNRSEAYGALSGELKAVAETQHAVRAETSKLVQALRASPKTRGRWGEHTLRNVLELSGSSAHCDFSTEESFCRGEDPLRPDTVIRLPGNRHAVRAATSRERQAARQSARARGGGDERYWGAVFGSSGSRSHWGSSTAGCVGGGEDPRPPHSLVPPRGSRARVGEKTASFSG